MTDKDRASFANLILLCHPHHVLVDKTEPEKYPIEILQQWKHDRECAPSSGAPFPEDFGGALERLIETGISKAIRIEIPLDAGMLTRPVGPNLTAYQTLWPKLGVVPFVDHAGILERLVEWCEDDARALAVFVEGPGGSGKTRSAVELIRNRSAKGWLAGFVRLDPGHGSFAIRRQRVDKLLVFDYANDEAHQISSFVEEILQDDSDDQDSCRLRLVLLNRSSSRSSRSSVFTAHQSSAGLLFDSASRITLPSSERTSGKNKDDLVFDLGSRRAVFESACKAIAEIKGSSTFPSTPDLVGDAYAVPLFVILAAILSMSEIELTAPATRDSILDRILSREAELFWVSCPEPDEAARSRAVCATTIAPASSESVARKRLEALGYPAQGVEGRRMAEWLASLYLGPNWANPLQPDLLGEFLLARSLDPTLAAYVLEHGTTQEASQAVRTLTRVLSSWLNDNLRNVLDATMPLVVRYIPIWIQQERRGNDRVSDALEAVADLIEILPLNVSLASIDFPMHLGPGGVKVAINALRRWLDNSNDKYGADKRHFLRARLAPLLADTGEELKALELISDAFKDPSFSFDDDALLEASLTLLSVEAYALTRTRNAGADASLVRAMNRLNGLTEGAREKVKVIDARIQEQFAASLPNRRAEAVEVLDNVVKMRRELVSSHGDAFVPTLAEALRARADARLSLRQMDQAREDIQIAIELLRDFVDREGTLFERDLAACLETAARVQQRNFDAGGSAQSHIDAMAARRRSAAAYGVDALFELLRSAVGVTVAGRTASFLKDAVDAVARLRGDQGLTHRQRLELLKLAERLAPYAETLEEQQMLLVDATSGDFTDGADEQLMKLQVRMAEKNAIIDGHVDLALDWLDLALGTSCLLNDPVSPILRVPDVVTRLSQRLGSAESVPRLDQSMSEWLAVLTESSDLTRQRPRDFLLAFGFLVGWVNSYKNVDEHASLIGELVSEHCAREGVQAHVVQGRRTRAQAAGALARTNMLQSSKAGSRSADSEGPPERAVARTRRRVRGQRM